MIETLASKKVLKYLLGELRQGRSGAEISISTKIGSGTLYPTLTLATRMPIYGIPPAFDKPLLHVRNLAGPPRRPSPAGLPLPVKDQSGSVCRRHDLVDTLVPTG